MPAVPSPASFEKIPRATPKRIAAITAAPANPPVAATGETALSTISRKAAGTADALERRVHVVGNVADLDGERVAGLLL
jgi:hypothetical protein